MNTDIFGTPKRSERQSAPTATWHESTWDLLRGLEVHEEDIPTDLLPAEWPVAPSPQRGEGAMHATTLSSLCAGG